MQVPIIGGAYIRREICISKLIGLVCSGKEIYHFCFVLLYILGQIPSTSPPRGLYLEGLIFGILWYVCIMVCHVLFFTYQTGAVHTDHYHDSDLTIGSVINIWGRKLLICDCDEFTKEYYKSKYGIGKLNQIYPSISF